MLLEGWLIGDIRHCHGGVPQRQHVWVLHLCKYSLSAGRALRFLLFEQLMVTKLYPGGGGLAVVDDADSGVARALLLHLDVLKLVEHGAVNQISPVWRRLHWQVRPRAVQLSRLWHRSEADIAVSVEAGLGRLLPTGAPHFAGVVQILVHDLQGLLPVSLTTAAAQVVPQLRTL